MAPRCHQAGSDMRGIMLAWHAGSGRSHRRHLRRRHRRAGARGRLDAGKAVAFSLFGVALRGRGVARVPGGRAVRGRRARGGRSRRRRRTPTQARPRAGRTRAPPARGPAEAARADRVGCQLSGRHSSSRRSTLPAHCAPDGETALTESGSWWWRARTACRRPRRTAAPRPSRACARVDDAQSASTRPVSAVIART